MPGKRLRIGILSDTHGYFHPELEDVLDGTDLILHAGDVGSVDILSKLECVAPVRGVYGNIDGPPIRGQLKQREIFKLGSLHCFMTHIGGRPGHWPPGIANVLDTERPDVFVCGHSHILRIERVKRFNGMLYLNPGAAGRQGFHRVQTCVLLHIEDGTAQKAEVVHLGNRPSGVPAGRDARR